MNWISKLVRVYSGILTTGIIIAAALITAICLVIFYATGMRYIFHKPQLWTEDLAGIFLIAASLLALAHCLRKGIHVRVELVISRLNPRLRGVADVVVALAGLIFASLLVWKGWNLAWISYLHGYTGMIPPGYPRFPSQVMVPIGCFLLALSFLELALRSVVKVCKG